MKKLAYGFAILSFIVFMMFVSMMNYLVPHQTSRFIAEITVVIAMLLAYNFGAENK